MSLQLYFANLMKSQGAMETILIRDDATICSSSHHQTTTATKSITITGQPKTKSSKNEHPSFESISNLDCSLAPSCPSRKESRENLRSLLLRGGAAATAAGGVNKKKHTIIRRKGHNNSKSVTDFYLDTTNTNISKHIGKASPRLSSKRNAKRVQDILAEVDDLLGAVAKAEQRVCRQ